MTKIKLKIWLAANQTTQAQLAEQLGITKRTISTYMSTERFPKWLPLALKSLEVVKTKYLYFASIPATEHGYDVEVFAESEEQARAEATKLIDNGYTLALISKG